MFEQILEASGINLFGRRPSQQSPNFETLLLRDRPDDYNDTKNPAIADQSADGLADVGRSAKPPSHRFALGSDAAAA